MFHEPFTSAWQQDWETGGKPEASFCLVRYLPLFTLFCSSSPKCLTSVNRQYRQQVQSIYLPTCRSHLAASGDRGLQCTAPSSPIKHSVLCSGGAAPWNATVPQLRNHVLTARAPANPGVVQSPGWSCGWRVPGEAVGSYPQPHWPAPGLIKLPIEDNRCCTLEGKDLYQAIFHLFSLLEPKEPAHILLDLRPLHPSLAYIFQTAVLGSVG